LGFDGVWVQHDTANTFRSLGGKGHSDVTSFSPGGSPGVSDDSVGSSVLGSVTNSGDGVIEVVMVSTVVEDTTGVTLEVVVGGVNGDSDWTGSDGSFEGRDVLVGDRSVR